jgi:PEP-CTERM motif
MKTRLLTMVTSLIVGWGVSTANAGILGITYTDVTPGSTIDLTSLGTLDWAKWGNGEPNDTLPYATPRDSSGTIINPVLTPLGSVPSGQSVVLVPFSPTAGETPVFSWTNSTIPMAGGNPVGTVVSETIIPAQSSYPVGLGASFQATADASPRTLDVYVQGFNTRMELTASLSGGESESLIASSATLIPIASGAGGNNYFSFGMFSIGYSGAGETLKITLTADNQSGIPTDAPQYGFSNAGVFAATVVQSAAVPEPSSIVLSTIGLGGLLGFSLVRRRNKSNNAAGGEWPAVGR